MNANGSLRKVLFVGPLPPPPGGVATVTRALLRSDLARRYQLIHCDTSQRLRVHQSGRLAPANWARAGGQWGRFVRFLLAEHPSLIHMPISGNVAGLLRDYAFVRTAAAFGVPVIGHVHGGTLIGLYGSPSRAARALVRSVFHRLRTTIALSPSLAGFFSENGLARESTVVSNPVDPEFTASLAAVEGEMRGREDAGTRGEIDGAMGRDGVSASLRPCGPASRSLRILFVGAVGRRKGVFDLITALPDVASAVPGAWLRVVGPPTSPGVFDEVREQVRERGLQDRVVFDGPLYGTAKAEAFLEADLLALPSYDEQFPCVLLEAMAAGLPVVTTNVGGIADMVRDGEHGFVLAAGDVPALTAALVALADPELRRRMGRAGAARVAAEYRIETAVERIAGVYEAVAAAETVGTAASASRRRRRGRGVEC